MLEIENLRAGYDRAERLHGVSARFRPGTLTAIIGPNGCGKTTLLKRAAAGDLPVSEPLMNDEADLEWMARRMGEIAGEEGRRTLFMGHGTDHAADETYVRLRALLPENAFLACVEGAHRLETILPRLDALKEKKLALAPLMLVAGDHAHNDLAGDHEDSWLSILTGRGFDVTVRMQGLGADEKVQARFVEKVGRALN